MNSILQAVTGRQELQHQTTKVLRPQVLRRKPAQTPWLPIATSHQRSSKIIKDHQRSSKIIKTYIQPRHTKTTFKGLLKTTHPFWEREVILPGGSVICQLSCCILIVLPVWTPLPLNKDSYEQGKQEELNAKEIFLRCPPSSAIVIF